MLWVHSIFAAIGSGAAPPPAEWDSMAVQAAVVEAVHILDILCRTDSTLVRAARTPSNALGDP